MTEPKCGPGRPRMAESERKKMASYRLAPDVLEILRSQPNASAYIDDAVREKKARDG